MGVGLGARSKAAHLEKPLSGLRTSGKVAGRGVTPLPTPSVSIMTSVVPDLHVWHSPAKQLPPTVEPGGLALAIFFCFPG